ncbi:hypothetical protein ACUIJN_25100 [Metabacillus halosaccharovorans]|uniref:hypothetical protein n=1 Tax=Metabacillus halosaccharovorans TaxID=930124 RepID=UPI0020401B95|nr:hypothetical protein [Metabacillus halosaccharovorans]MCM3441407.1 hypothetical protein [Metabacillus halosaccharovorans]
MVNMTKLLNKILISGVVLLLIPSIIVLFYSKDIPEKVVSGKVLTIDGYTLLIKTNEDKMITGKLQNIYNTKEFWDVFDEILIGAYVEIELYGKDEEGDYLVEVNVDGVDFDEYVVNSHYASNLN